MEIATVKAESTTGTGLQHTRMHARMHAYTHACAHTLLLHVDIEHVIATKDVHCTFLKKPTN